MQNNEKIKLKLGQKIYKYSTIYLMEYEVFGVLEREDGTYYQIKCLSCTHCEGCEVLIKLDDVGRFKYVSMLNKYDEDVENCEYHWHTTDDKDYYCLSKKEAMEKVFKRNISLCETSISQLKEQIKDKERTIIQYKELIKAL